jgi:type II secretion system protein N
MKKALMLFPVALLVCLYLFFPFNDLGDLVAAQIAEKSQGQVAVTFDRLGVSLVPQPGLDMDNVTVEGSGFPPLIMKGLHLSPNIAGLLSFKPGVNVQARGLFGGDVAVSTRGGDKVAATNQRKQIVNIDLENLDLGELSAVGQIPIKAKGLLSGSINSQVDPGFTDAPVGELELRGDKVVISDTVVPTQLGPLALPNINIGPIELIGRSDSKGLVEISRATLGKQGSDLSLQASGKFDMRFDKFGASISPRMGSYDFNVKLQVTEAVRQKLGAYLAILQAYQTTPNSYSFRIAAQSPNVPPNISRAQ